MSVESQDCLQLLLAIGCHDVEMRGIGGSPLGSRSVLDIMTIPVVPVPVVVWVQTLLIYSIDSQSSMGALLAAAYRLRVGECTCRSVMELLEVDRRCGKWSLLVVEYLYHLILV